MLAHGWSNLLISREERFFQIVRSKDQRSARLVVEPQTGRLRGDDND